MPFAVAHLSDIHFSEKGNIVADRGPQIARAMQPHLDGIADLLLLVSGDVAFSGKTKEYDAAGRMFDSLIAEFSRSAPAMKVHCFAVPGNHDCNFERNNDVRDMLITSLVRDDKAHIASPAVVGQCVAVQAEFWEFEAALSKRARPDESRAGYIEVLEIDGRRIELLGLNSAWLSQKKEQPGTLAVPASSIAIPQGNADFRIAFAHHPSNWQAPGAARAFREFIIEGVDVMLVGHEHASDITEVGRPNGSSVLVLDAPALQEGGQRSGFALLRIDLAARTLERRTFSWKSASNGYLATQPEITQLERVGKAAHSNARPRKSFLADLRDPGTNFTHPRADSIHLEDLFVWPDIDVRSFKRLLNGTSISFSGANSRARLREFKKIVIEGTERSGRTSLAKSLALDLLAEGKTVLLLDGGALDSPSSDKFMQHCERAYAAQYDGLGLDAIRQGDPDDIAVVIDDFDSGRLRASDLVSLLDAASRLFGRVVALVSDLFSVQELIAHEAIPKLLDFQHVVVSELGHRARRELVERWYRIGADLLPSGADFEHVVADAERFVSNHVGRGIFPSYPICVLTLLQAHDAGVNTDLSAGAYGAIYEVLLQSALHRHARRVPVEFLQTFLAELAIHMLRSGRREVSEAEFGKLATSFMRDTLTDFSLNDIHASLGGARMLVFREGSVRFRYAHIYYLSCSKALQMHRQDPSRRDAASRDIDGLFESLYTDASSNIVMFYLHFSRDLEAVGRLVEVANRLFEAEPLADPEAIDFGSKAPWPAGLLEEIESDPQEGIRKYRAAQDEADRLRDSLRSEDEKVIEQLNQYHTCVKALHLIGQVVRSFPGLLPRDLKLRAAGGVIRLSLRALSDFANVVRNSRDELRGSIIHYLTTTHRVPRPDEVKERADQAIFYLALAAGHGLLRRAAMALGSSHIFPTLDVLRADGIGVGFELIEFSVRLDHDRERADLRGAVALKERLSSGFSVLVLRQMVADYLLMYRLPAGLRANFAREFDIRMKEKLLPEGRTLVVGRENREDE